MQSIHTQKKPLSTLNKIVLI